MKKVFFSIIVLFSVLVLLTYLDGSFYEGITGKVTVDKFIRSVNHPSKIQTNAVIFYVSTVERSKCSYALSLKDSIGYMYFKPVDISDGYSHSQLLTGLKTGDYDINVKCVNNEGFMQTSVSKLSVNLPSNCVVYCQYETKCQEMADDSCSNLCIRDTEGLICGENKICNDGACAEKQLDVVEIFEEEPGLVIEEKGLLERFVLWLKGLLS